jgi:copper chaperone CopZ
MHDAAYTSHRHRRTITTTHHHKENIMSTQTFPVTGLTCGHCVGAITSELRVLAGVRDVQIELVNGGTSTLSVTADKALTDDEVAEALDEAGDYQIAAN